MEELPEAQSKSTSKKAILLIVAIALVSAIIAGGVVYAYQKNQKEKQTADLQEQLDELKVQVARNSVAPTPSPSATPTLAPSITPTPSPAATTITEAMIKNAEYSLAGLSAGAQKVTLKDGAMSSATMNVTANHVLIGDFDSNGTAEGLVEIRANFGGSGIFPVIYLAKKTGNGIATEALLQPTFEDRDVINSIVFSSGVVTFDATVHGPEDPSCCASVHQVSTFSFDGAKLVPKN